MEQPHERVKDMLENPCTTERFFGSLIRKGGLDVLDVPVTEFMPGELVQRLGRVIESIRLDRFMNLTDGDVEP